MGYLLFIIIIFQNGVPLDLNEIKGRPFDFYPEKKDGSIDTGYVERIHT